MRRLSAPFLAVVALLAGSGFLYAVEIDGPDRVDPYRLARLTLGDLPDGASAVWRVFPVGVADGMSADGGATFAFTGPPGRYDVWAVVLIEGRLEEAAQTVTIGGTPTPPGPTPPGPTPPGPVPPDPVPPAPDLTGLAKVAYDAARPLNDPATARRYAENHAGITSAIAAGAYNGMSFEAARSQIFADLSEANRPVTAAAPAWRSFGTAVTAEMNAMQARGELNSVDAIGKALLDIQTGLEAIAR